MFPVVLAAGFAVVVVLNLLLLSRLRSHDAFEARLRDDVARAQQRQSEDSRALREEIAAGIQRFAGQNEQRSESLRSAMTLQLESIRGVVDQRLFAIQTDNAAKLEQMRQTVDGSANRFAW